VIVLHRPHRWPLLVFIPVAVVMTPAVIGQWDVPPVVAVAFCAFALVVSAREYVSRVEVTAAEVRVVNLFGSDRVPLADVLDVTVDWHDVTLLVRDRRPVRVDAFSLGPRDLRSARKWRRREYERLVAAIQAARAGELADGVVRHV
jgi:hypothetical protein